MKRTTNSRLLRFSLPLALLVCLVALGGGAVRSGRALGAANVQAGPSAKAGTVYALTNSFAMNKVVIYKRAANGKLTETRRVATGGLGTNVFEIVDRDARARQLDRAVVAGRPRRWV